MAPFTTRSAASLNPLGGVFAQSDGAIGTTPTFAGLAGFDVIAQFSRRLLQAEVIRSLGRNHLSPLSAFVPWGSVPLPASLLATLSAPFRISLSAREARLELRLVDPHIAGLHWPVDIADLPDGPVASTARAARGIPRQRVIDIGWRLEINVLIARFDTAIAAAVPQSGGPSPSPPSRGASWAGITQFVATTGSSSGSDGGVSWDRSTLATGSALTSARADPVVTSSLWRFGMGLDFSETTPSITSETAAGTDFLATDAGKNMLSQALASLKAATGVKLTPDVAPGGAISASYVQRMSLPPFRVRDLLLGDPGGEPVLCLCADLGSATGGVARQVQPFLAGADFAYGVAMDVLGPALKLRWNVAATGLSIVANTPVDLPVDDDPNHIAPGLAQVQVSFSNVLDDVSIQAATDHRGDPIRFLSKQRIQLLNLWDQDGKRVTDVGPLADPQNMPFVLPINVFDRGSGQATELQPQFKAFLFKLMTTVVFPILEPFSVGKDSVSGFASSAMKLLVIRWSLKSPLDDIRAPISDTAGAQL